MTLWTYILRLTEGFYSLIAREYPKDTLFFFSNVQKITKEVFILNSLHEVNMKTSFVIVKKKWFENQPNGI